MKKIMTLLMLALMVQLASAAYSSNSILNLKMNDNATFRVSIDGKPASNVGQSARFENLAEGSHLVQVDRLDRRYRFQSFTRAYSGYVNLGANTESFATIYAPNVVKFDRVVALIVPHAPELYGPFSINNHGHEGYANHDRENEHSGHRHNHDYNYQDDHCGTPVPAGPVAMSDYDFGQLKQTLCNASFENSRLDIFEQALAYNYFTTQQVRSLMDEFWFESTKLQVAKLAYNKTVDPNNYYLVNNEFAFSSSIRELGDYVAMR
jgi:hypothetical protein